MRKRILLAAVVAVLLAGSQGAGAASAQTLLRQWTALDDQCRGGTGSDRATLDACDEREVIARRLQNAGWCYGKGARYRQPGEWTRCN